MKQNKYLYLYILQIDYACGYEDVTAEETYKDIILRRQEYRDNEPGYPKRVIKRRELNPEYQGAAQ